MFVHIHFNVPPNKKKQIWLVMYQMKRFIDMEQSPLICLCFCFYQLGLYSVSYTANEYSIYHFCIVIKNFYFFFKCDYCPRPGNCNFLCVIYIYKYMLCVIHIYKYMLFIYTSRPSLLFQKLVRLISLNNGFHCFLTIGYSI